MEQFFNKAVLFADSHFGRSADSPLANQDNLAFIDWMIERARSWGAETCIFLGDYFHNRASVGIASLDAALTGLERLSRAGFEKIVFLKGNHDLARRVGRDISSLNFAQHVPHIQLIHNPLTVGNVTFLPWLYDHELAQLPPLGRYVFGHLETIGAMMNSRMVCGETQHAIEPDRLSGPERVLTGHFHQRQTLHNITYIGSIMPFDFNDSNDADRGLTLLRWGHDPIFEPWPEQPLYYAKPLSELLDELSELRPNMTVRTTIDIPLQYSETQEIRQTLVESYGLRKIELLPTALSVAQEPTQGKPALHTVDQIVIDGLRGIDSVGINAGRLVEIFSTLPR